MKLSIIIPARNEEDCLEETVLEVIKELQTAKIDNEVVIVNDNSTDQTGKIALGLSEKYANVKLVNRSSPPGFGWAIRDGLKVFSGEAVVIYMGDASDDPKDIVKYYKELAQGCDCVFGSRFVKGAVVKDYPCVKLFFNRLGNYFIKCLFGLKSNDISNAFKAYRREVIEAIDPLVSNHYNITVEIPLKAVVRGFSYKVVPINWYGRTSGVSKLHLREMQRKYLFSIFYVFLEKILLKTKKRK